MLKLNYLIILFFCNFVVLFVKCETVDTTVNNNVTETTNSNQNNNEKLSRVLEDEDFPTETQSAQCTITSGDVMANAQASTSKRLFGVCGAKEMRKSFETLEAKLLQEIYTIKLMLLQLQNPNQNNFGNNNYGNLSPAPPSNYNFSPPPTTMKPQSSENHAQNIPNEIPDIFFPTDEPAQTQFFSVFSSIPTPQDTNTQEKPLEFQKILLPSENLQNRDNFNEEEPKILATKKSLTLNTKTLESKFIPLQQQQQQRPKSSNKFSPRDFEVHRFNNTIISNSETQIFTYFWKIENFTLKLKSNTTEICSPIFTISGLHIRVKANLNHLNRDYLYLQLESVPNDIILKDKSSNIILQSGSIFKEIETKQLFRHKIIILDQGNLKQTDMISQEFFNTNSGFMIPNSAITSSSYSKHDIILIKIIIFL